VHHGISCNADRKLLYIYIAAVEAAAATTTTTIIIIIIIISCMT
jgi:hypothetical protein